MQNERYFEKEKMRDREGEGRDERDYIIRDSKLEEQ